jgi:divalent metal cation (Fe/Co/Zn/Cd) transporter
MAVRLPAEQRIGVRGGLSSIGRASECGSEGYGFETHRPPQPSVTATRENDLRRALWLSVFSVAWNGIAGSIAAYVALGTGSLSLLGFGVDAVIDSIASVALIWRFAVESSQPARAARVERLAERVVGIALILLAVYLVAGSIRALATQSHPDASFASMALLVASVIVLPPLARAKYLVARRLGSGALRLDSILTAVAALLAAISLASLAASDTLGLWWADAVAAIVVAVILAREGFASMGAARPEGDVSPGP